LVNFSTNCEKTEGIIFLYRVYMQIRSRKLSYCSK